MLFFAIIEYGIVMSVFSVGFMFTPIILFIGLAVLARFLDWLALLFMMFWPYLVLFLIFDLTISLLRLIAKHYFSPLKYFIPIIVIIMGIAVINPFYKPLPHPERVAAIEVTDWEDNYARVYKNERTVNAFVKYLDDRDFRRTFDYRAKCQGDNYPPMGEVNYLDADGKVLKTIGFYWDGYILDGMFHYKTINSSDSKLYNLSGVMSTEIEETERVRYLEVPAGDESNASDSVETTKMDIRDWIVNNAQYSDGVLTFHIPDLPYEKIYLKRVTLVMKLAKYQHSNRFKTYYYEDKDLIREVTPGELIEIPIENVLEDNTVDRISILFRYNNNMEEGFQLKSVLPVELQYNP